jgi:hypothetical protein
MLKLVVNIVTTGLETVKRLTKSLEGVKWMALAQGRVSGIVPWVV